MLKTLLLFFLAMATTTWTFARCDGDAPKTGPSEVTVNLPFTNEGKEACYHQKNTLNIIPEKTVPEDFVEFELITLNAELENIPAPEIKHFFHIDYEMGKPSQVYFMSFLCSGETPIGGDAFSDSLTHLVQKKNSDPEASVFIATGMASDNLSVNQAKKARSKVFDRFLSIFEERSGYDISRIENTGNIYIPSVLSSLNVISPTERKLYSSFFSRIGSSINGCSRTFLTLMQDLQLENLVQMNSFPEIELKKKLSSNYKLKWSLR